MKVVTIGGGTGQFHLLQALRILRRKLSEQIVITAIPTTSDSGGSSGIIRLEGNVIAPGDISQCLFGLHPEPELVAPLFGHRFQNGSFKGHTLRNIIVLSYFERFGATQKAMDSIREVFHLEGSIAPSTFTSTNLHALLKDGTELENENDINEADLLKHGGVQKLWLDPLPQPNPSALTAISQADVIIVCPGTLVCSLVPNFLVPKMADALQQSRAKKIHIVNLMNRRGHEPSDWSVFDHVRFLESYLGEGFFDVVLCNTQALSVEQRGLYEKEKTVVSLVKNEETSPERIWARPLLMDAVPSRDVNDAIAHTRSFVRHDPARVADALAEILSSFH